MKNFKNCENLISTLRNKKGNIGKIENRGSNPTPRRRNTVGSEKRTPWWNQDVKEVIRAIKDAFNALVHNKSTCYMKSRYSEVRKAAASGVKMSNEHFCEEFGGQLNFNKSFTRFQLFKGFWQTIRRLCGK